MSEGKESKEDEVESKQWRSDSESDEELSSDEEDWTGPLPDFKSTARLESRRNSVSSRPLDVDDDFRPPLYPKSEGDRAAIIESLTSSMLFSKLEPTSTAVIVDAMQMKSFEKDEEIIKQGDDGDLFYVLEEGICDIFVDGVGRVLQVEAGSERNYFGELALFYDTPRAATVQAITEVRSWALDRITFKKIMMDTTMKQRNLHKAFLEDVPILKSLQTYERLTLADALAPVHFAAGEGIIREGDAGNEFFIIKDGEVKVTKAGIDEEVSKRLLCGDYFGELALLGTDTRQATVTATEDTLCLTLNRKTFKRLLGPLESLLKQNADLYEER